MGLHLDVNKIHADNQKKEGLRKYVGVLINEGDKLTKEEKVQKKLESLEMYGLPKSFYRKIVLPPKTELKVFNVEHVMNHKKKLSTIEKIKILTDTEEHLIYKIKSKLQGSG